MKIGVIVGSTRRGRKGDQVGHWVARRAAEQNTAQGGQAEFEVIDLADHQLGFYEDEVHPAGANKQYADPATQAWSERIDGFDAFIFVTPEYNHSVPAPMKNAFDMLFHEWARKAVAFVSYGAAGGIRAVEHWRAIVANAHMLDARSQLTVFLETDFVNDVFTPNPQLETNLAGVVDELLQLTHASKTLRVNA